MRTIVHLHFHKCAGSSIVNLLSKCGYRPYSQLSGLLPWFVDEAVQGYTPEQLAEFYENSARIDGVNLISFEWWKPIFFANRNIHYVTVLRDPFERFLSDYFFSFHHEKGFKEKGISLEDYSGYREGSHYSDNYYCKLLLNKPASHIITDDNLNHAVNELFKINTVVILENPDTYKRLDKIPRVRHSKLPMINKTQGPKRYSQRFKNRWIKENEHDYTLYSIAKLL